MRKEKNKKFRSNADSDDPTAGAPALDTTFVTHNMQRGADKKSAITERLLEATGFPAFVGLQETGAAKFELSTTAAVLNSNRRHKYVPFVQQRAGGSTHGGAALLVRSDMPAEPCDWPEATRWSSECEAVSVRVHPRNGAPPFTVSSLYVRGGSTDVEGFRTLLRSVRDDQILLGDFNAQLPGSPGASLALHARQRGQVLQEFIESRGAMCPTPTGPTHYKTTRDADGRLTRRDDGTFLDYIIVGGGVAAQIISSECDATVLGDVDWGSDHQPVVWSAALGTAGAQTTDWCRRVAWHRIDKDHREHFGRVFRDVVERGRREHRLDMCVIEKALLVASEKALPYVRPARGEEGLFWTAALREKMAATVEQHGTGDRAAMTATVAAERRATLARAAKIDPNPSSCWDFTRRYFNFNNQTSLCPPLETGAPDGAKVIDPQARADALARHWAAVQADPPPPPPPPGAAAAAAAAAGDQQEQQQQPPRRQGAQDKLADLVRDAIPPRASAACPAWNRLTVTELRACVGDFTSGKCADQLGLRAEHLKLLDDESLAAMLPYVDRCIGHGLMPTHWRSALVTPVPKRKRDLSLLKSWRPVSVTPLLCRLCETVVHYRVQHVIEQGGHRRGKSQFGFRRGVGTSLPLSGLSMFIRDGLGARQSRVFPEWDARDPEKRDSIRHGEQATAKNVDRQHSTLLVSIDGSDAYCRALPHKAIRKLLDMGLANEARWVAALLTDRSLIVKSGRCRSAPHPLMRGVPQGSVLAPMLWSLVIDDLIAECERICDKPVPGCVVVPIIFADDVNFAIRGFNPQSCIAQANVLMQAVRAWSLENGVPMAKLQASWIVGGNSANWARDWTAEQGEVIFDDNLRCTPKTEPIKLLGVTFDSAFCFDNHVDSLVEQCERYLRLLTAMKSTLKGERLAILYRGMILSRMLFAVDAWYPFLARCHRDRLEQIHERGCRIITGTSKTSHGVSACYEAGFRSFEETARDEIVKLADRMRRMPGGDPDPGSVDRVYGTEWVARLFRDGRMPTAGLRPVTRANGLLRVREPDVYPFDDFDRALSKPDSLEEDALRDIGFKLHHGDPRAARRDPRALHKSLRPLPRVHPWAPHELAVFDTHISFVASAPDGLVKQRVFDACGKETGPTEEQAPRVAGDSYYDSWF